MTNILFGLFWENDITCKQIKSITRHDTKQKHHRHDASASWRWCLMLLYLQPCALGLVTEAVERCDDVGLAVWVTV